KLERSPRLAHGFRGPLGPRRAVGGSVFGELSEAVRVDDRALGPGRDDDEVAVPAREYVEGIQHLVTLGSTCGAPQPLLQLTRGFFSRGLRLGPRARIGSAFLSQVRHTPRRGRGIERRVQIDGASELKEDPTALAR